MYKKEEGEKLVGDIICPIEIGALAFYQNVSSTNWSEVFGFFLPSSSLRPCSTTWLSLLEARRACSGSSRPSSSNSRIYNSHRAPASLADSEASPLPAPRLLRSPLLRLGAAACSEDRRERHQRLEAEASLARRRLRQPQRRLPSLEPLRHRPRLHRALAAAGSLAAVAAAACLALVLLLPPPPPPEGEAFSAFRTPPRRV